MSGTISQVLFPFREEGGSERAVVRLSALLCRSSATEGQCHAIRRTGTRHTGPRNRDTPHGGRCQAGGVRYPFLSGFRKEVAALMFNHNVIFEGRG